MARQRRPLGRRPPGFSSGGADHRGDHFFSGWLSDRAREALERRLDEWLAAHRGLDARPDEHIDPDRFLDLF
jgi:hypothetical protein